MPIIVICSSASFYYQANELVPELKTLGYRVVLPHNAREMAKTGDFDTSHTKTWYENPEDYTKKADYMRMHFDEIAKGDAVLVLNYEKHGQQNYIGPNVLMEMGLAFHLRKPIYVLNDLPENSPFEEELKGFMPVILHGKVDKIAKKYLNM